jgi:PadR family transcriptional regulator
VRDLFAQISCTIDGRIASYFARGWIEAEWGASDNNRKARFCELTKAGRKQLGGQTRQWRRLTAAIGRILGPAEG